MKCTFPSLAILAALSLTARAAIITTNVARSGQVIYTSAQYNADFNGSRVIDGKTDELTTSPTSYWLTPNGNENGSLILDLRRAYAIKGVNLFNTHNRQFNDRGTLEFQVYAGDDVRPKYPGGNVDRYYPIDGDTIDKSGSAVDALFIDSPAGSDIPGTYESDVPAAIGSGRSLSFTGAGERMEIVDPAGMLQPTAYTISLWVKFPDVAGSSGIISRTASSGNEGSTWSHQLRLFADPATGLSYFQHYLYDGAGKMVSGTTPVEANVWYHIAGTAQNNADMHLFVNGIEEGAPAPVGALWTGGSRWTVGTGSGGGFSQVPQLVDDVAVYLSALSGDLVKRLAKGEKGTAVVNSSAAPIGTELVNARLILSGSLSDVNGQADITPDNFTTANGLTATTARYVEFRSVSASNAAKNGGLNELQVIADVDDTAPSVGIAPAALLSWPVSPFAYSLQSSATLNPGVWTAVAATPVQVSTNLQFFVPADKRTLYYRLVNP